MQTAGEASPVARILLVEDDRDLAELTAELLELQGHTVVIDDGRRALDLILETQPDLVLLDVELPSMTGFGICNKARRGGYTGPVVFLTARRTDVDELLAFELGGDDFVRKPVDPRILVLRVAAGLRRVQSSPTWTDGELSIDGARRLVSVREEPVPLTTGQFDLLLLLARTAPEPVDRAAYYARIRGIAYDGMDRGYDSRIRELRARLAPWGVDTRIVTVRGVGYALAPPT
ncbi:MAG: response regulator transcription factor [Alphaproteobacteria bacterium]|nr:response regulator transcription factor [Alphaproteobacteria bacterium]MCB9672766.1 response regulator transcription factor [Alphaproteobacteria bacterium]